MDHQHPHGRAAAVQPAQVQVGARRDPIVAVATAPGRGAVGVVRISSSAPLDALIQVLCGRPLAARQATRARFLDADGAVLDDGLALHFPAPASYTGEHVLELQGHGGRVVLDLLVQRCLQAGQGMGLRLARPGEFSERAFLHGKLDLAQAEAVADLIDASTATAARAAARSLTGVFSTQVHQLRDALVALRTLVEATLDFPDEDIEFIESAAVRERVAQAASQCAAILAQARQGALLREGVHVVIAGQPNAGKSSLLNALAGVERAIVTPVAGTTRDVLREAVQIEGVPLHIVDTAGLRASDDVVERIGIERAWAELEMADVVLFLRDAALWNDPETIANNQELMLAIGQKCQKGTPIIVLDSKADLRGDPGVAAEAAPSQAVLRVSTQTGEGLDALRSALLEAAGWQSGGEGGFLARTRHVQALRAAQSHLELAEQILRTPTPALELLAEELRLSLDALGAITGEFGAEDLLGEIFSNFCIGK